MAGAVKASQQSSRANAQKPFSIPPLPATAGKYLMRRANARKQERCRASPHTLPLAATVTPSATCWELASAPSVGCLLPPAPNEVFHCSHGGSFSNINMKTLALPDRRDQIRHQPVVAAVAWTVFHTWPSRRNSEKLLNKAEIEARKHTLAFIYWSS